MKTYTCDIVAQVQDAYHDVPISSFKTTVELIEAHAKILLAEYEAESPVAKFHISNWHPELVGKSAEVIFSSPFSMADSLRTLSREFGFTDWADTQDRSSSFDQDFERCVDLVLQGDLDGVKSALIANPRFASQTSSFGHQATLLLYLGANGVETWRQYVPMNAPAMARLLIEHGADQSATLNVYGGEFDCVAMVESSAHPKAAGVAKELVAVLRDK